MADKKEKGFGEKAGKFIGEKIGLRITATAIMTLLAWYAQEKSVTVAQFNQAYASIPLVGILIAVVFDYGLDTGKLYNKIFGKGRNSLEGFIFGIVAVAAFFLAFTWTIAGSITLDLMAISPEVLVAAGLVALVVLLPNTGTSEWLLWLWIAETIVTGGDYIAILPAIPIFGVGGG